MVSLAVDADSDNRGGNGGGNDGGKGDAVDFSNSYCPRDTRIEGGDSTDMFIFSGNGGNTLLWN